MLRAHVVYRDDVEVRRPPAAIVSHLAEYVVRVALRGGWDLADLRTAEDRIRRMMFAERSELIEMADNSALAFVEDVADKEVELSVRDICDGTAGSSQVDATFVRSTSAGAMRLS